MAFTDDATGEQREKAIQLQWFKGRDALRRDALRIVSAWHGISNPRVVATLTTGDKEWVPEPNAEKSDD